MQSKITLLSDPIKLSNTQIVKLIIGLGFGCIYLFNFIGRFNFNSAIDDKAFLFLTSFMLFDASAASHYLSSFSEHCLNSIEIINSAECWWQSYYRGSTYYSYPILSLSELILRNLFKPDRIQIIASLSFNYAMLFSALFAITLMAFAGTVLRLSDLLIYWFCILLLLPYLLNHQIVGDVSGLFVQHGFYTPVPRGLAVIVGIFALFFLSIKKYHIALIFGVLAATFHIQFIVLVPIIFSFIHLDIRKSKWFMFLIVCLLAMYGFILFKYGIFSRAPLLILGIFLISRYISTSRNDQSLSTRCIFWLLFFSLILFLSKSILEVLSSDYLSTFTPLTGGPLKFWYGRIVVEAYNRYTGLFVCSAVVILIHQAYNQLSLNSLSSKLLLACAFLFLLGQQHFFSYAKGAVENISNFSNQFIELSGSDSREMAAIYLNIANELYERNLDK